MSEDETTITTETTLEADGCVIIPPAGRPAATVISVTITIGGAQAKAEPEAAPQKPKYMGQGRINEQGRAS
jgi:hypothetical protein